MKWFCLKWWLLVVALLCLTVGSTLGFVCGKWPLGVLCLLCLGCVIACQWGLVMRLARVMKIFVAGLEVDDMTMHFEIGRKGSELRRMSDSMNRLTEMYRAGCLELETRKLYYDRILRIMTHEMRNSITPVIALAQDMKKRGEAYDAQSMSDALDVILSQSQGIRRFLDSYYELTHLPEPELETLEAVEFFNKVRRIGETEAGRLGLGSEVIHVSVAEGLYINADPGLLTQGVVNLLRNALEAVAGCENPYVKLMAARVDGGAGITITDNGCGFAAGAGEWRCADMLFQPFYTTKTGGSGIGLCLSRQIARLHGGDLRLLGTSSHGSTMFLYLPY